MDMKITKFSRPVCRDLRNTFEAEVAELAAKYGLNTNFGSMRFSDTECTLKLELSVAGVEPVEERDFKELASMYGLEASDLGRKYKSRTKIFTVAGLLRKKHKNNIKIVDQNGKVFITTGDEVKRMLAFAEV